MTIEELVEDGLNLIRDDAHHDLRLSLRRRIWAALDETRVESSARIGHARRVTLAVLAVEKVLPLWEALLPEDRAPHESLGVVREVMAGTVAAAAAARIAGEVWTHCDNLASRYSGENQSVILVGYAAVQVIHLALSDEFLSSNSADADIDVDPYEHDPWCCAAAAYSRGSIWQDQSDSKKRLEFWTWWLTSAVASAISGTDRRGDRAAL